MSDTEVVIRLILREDGEVFVRCLTGFDLTVATALRPHKEEIIRMLRSVKITEEKKKEDDKRGRNIVL